MYLGFLGGQCRFYFYGNGDFLKLRRCSRTIQIAIRLTISFSEAFARLLFWPHASEFAQVLKGIPSETERERERRIYESTSVGQTNLLS